MAEDDKVDIEFGATTEGLHRGVNDAAKTVEDAGKRMASGMDPAQVAAVALGVAIEGLGEKIVSMVSNAIEKSIHAYADLGNQLEHLQHRIGTSAVELSALKVGLDSVGLSTGVFEGIARRLPMVLEQHTEKFKAAGVAYADADGNLLPLRQTVQNIVDHLEKFTAGSARNIEGVKLLGRTFYQFADLVEMTSSRMAEAKEVAEEFGLVLTEKDLDATNEFSRETKLLQEAMHGFYVYVGKAVTPALTELATNLRESLVPVFNAFKVVVQTVVGVLGSLWMGFVTVAGAATMLGATLRLPISLMHALWTALSSGGKVGLEEARKAIADYKEEMVNLSGWVVNEITRTNAAISGLIDGKTSGSPKEPNSPDPSRGKVDTGTLAIMQAESERILALQKERLREMAEVNDDDHAHNVKTEEEYWAEKIRIEQVGYDAEVAAKKTAISIAAIEEKNAKIAGDIAGVKSAKAKEYSLTTDIMVLEEKRKNAAVQGYREMENAISKKNLAGQKELDATAMEEQKAITDEQTRQFKRREDMAVEAAQQEKSLGLLGIEQAKQNDEFMVQLGKLTYTQQLDNLKAYEQQKLDLELAVITKEKQRRDLDAGQQKALLEKELEERKKFDLKISELNKKKWAEEHKYQLQFIQGTKSAFQSTIQSILNGTMTLTQSVKSLFQGMLDVVAGIFAKIAADWIEKQLMMMIFGQQVHNAKVGELASEAGAGGVASMAAAPFPLNLGAPAFGAAMYAAAMAFGSIGGMLGGGGGAITNAAGLEGTGLAVNLPSYDVGAWQIPTDQIAKVHKDEMIVSAKSAEKMRRGSMSDGINVTIHAIDAAGVKRLFMQHGSVLADSLKAQVRNFKAKK